jgi:hypothetical protein
MFQIVSQVRNLLCRGVFLIRLNRTHAGHPVIRHQGGCARQRDNKYHGRHHWPVALYSRKSAATPIAISAPLE